MLTAYPTVGVEESTEPQTLPPVPAVMLAEEANLLCPPAAMAKLSSSL